MGIYDPITDTYSDVAEGAHGRGAGAFVGGVLAPNGKVILVPYNSDRMGIYDPITNTYSDMVTYTHGKGDAAFAGGVLAPNGKVILVPYNSDRVGIYGRDHILKNKNDPLAPYFNKF